jgi:hypothetical protein
VGPQAAPFSDCFLLHAPVAGSQTNCTQSLDINKYRWFAFSKTCVQVSGALGGENIRSTMSNRPSFVLSARTGGASRRALADRFASHQRRNRIAHVIFRAFVLLLILIFLGLLVNITAIFVNNTPKRQIVTLSSHDNGLN